MTPAKPATPGRRLSPLTPLVRGFVVVVAAAATSWDDLLRGDPGPVAIIFLVLLVGGGVYGVASWALTRFWVSGEELRVDTGVVQRQSRRIRIDRIQGVDVAQPLVARLLGVAELRMDVAGGSTGEGKLAYLRLSDAHELRRTLLARRTTLATGSESPGSVATGSESPGSVVTGELLARVPPGRLVGAVLLSSETLVLLAAVIVLTVLVSQSVSWGAVGPGLPAVGGLALVLVSRFLRWYGFTVHQGEAGLHVRRGLLDITNQTIRVPRIQGIVISEPLLWRRFGWVRVDVSVAGYATSAEDGGPSVLIPVTDRRTADDLVARALPAVGMEPGELRAAPRRSRWLDPVGFRFLAYACNDTAVAARAGWWVRRTHLVPHARIQSLGVSQGPVQRALGLSTLVVHSPPGPVDVRARHRLVRDTDDLLDQAVRLARAARTGDHP